MKVKKIKRLEMSQLMDNINVLIDLYDNPKDPACSKEEILEAVKYIKKNVDIVKDLV